MDFEQIIKRMDWLEDELRKSKSAVSESNEKILSVENDNKKLRKKIKDLSSEISNLATAAGRIAEFDNALNLQRKEFTLFIEDIEKRRSANQKETEKRNRLEFDGINKSLLTLNKQKDSLSALNQEWKKLKEEDIRLSQGIAQFQTKMDAVSNSRNEWQHGIKVLEAARREDNKHLIDLEGEFTALRKRVDQVREKTDVFFDNLRRIETRLNEMVAGEVERNQAQTNFIETQSRLQIDRNHTWNEWQVKFDQLSKLTEALDSQLQVWDATQRSVKRAQESYQEITTKFERRINEITEIQRLADDRFRQEWTTFKADDQKRWNNLSLTQDEFYKEVHSAMVKAEDHINSLEDMIQTHKDVLQQTKEINEQMLNAILVQLHEFLQSYERIVGPTD